jgi:hypothetical protein
MWIDEEGAVHVAMRSDPFQALPGQVTAALRRHLLVPEGGDRVLDRYLAVGALLEHWDEELFEQLGEHLDEVGTAPPDTEEAWDPPDDEEPAQPDALPPELLRVLEDHVHAAPFAERLDLLHHVDRVVAAWEALYLDHEKALGHLLLAHAPENQEGSGEPGTGAPENRAGSGEPGTGAPENRAGSDGSADITSRGHEELLALHATWHGSGGPGHGPEW